MTDLALPTRATGLAFWDIQRALTIMAPPTGDPAPRTLHSSSGHHLQGERQWVGEYSVRWSRWEGRDAGAGGRRVALSLNSAVIQLDRDATGVAAGDVPLAGGEDHQAFEVDIEVRQLDPAVLAWGVAYRVPLSSDLDTDIRYGGFQMALSLAFAEVEEAGADETRWRTTLESLVYRLEFALLEVPYRGMYCDAAPGRNMATWGWAAPWLSLDQVSTHVQGLRQLVQQVPPSTRVRQLPDTPASSFMERAPHSEVVLVVPKAGLLVYAMWQRYAGLTTAVRVTIVSLRPPVETVSAVVRVLGAYAKTWRRWFRQLQQAATIKDLQDLFHGKLWADAGIVRWLKGDSYYVHEGL